MAILQHQGENRLRVCFVLNGGGKIQVGKNLGLSQGCVICVNNAKLILGDKFRCNYSTTIDCSDADIEIGDDVVLG